MGEPATTRGRVEEPEPPLHDPTALARSVDYHRRKRAARVERRRELRFARARFWLVLLCLALAAAVIGVLILQQVQNIFGI
jgi:cell division septal protein FtsQ